VSHLVTSDEGTLQLPPGLLVPLPLVKDTNTSDIVKFQIKMSFIAGIIYNYIDGTHYKLWIDFSQHASITCYHPLYVMSPTLDHVFVSSIHYMSCHHPLYICFQPILCGYYHVFVSSMPQLLIV
jgi:hypothetical protein